MQRNLSFLKKINKRTKNSRKKHLENCSSDNIAAISEIAHNLLKGNINIKKKDFDRLKKHKGDIRNLAARTISNSKKKKILIQRGGFLPIILSPLLAGLGSFAGKILANSLGI